MSPSFWVARPRVVQSVLPWRSRRDPLSGLIWSDSRRQPSSERGRDQDASIPLPPIPLPPFPFSWATHSRILGPRETREALILHFAHTPRKGRGEKGEVIERSKTLREKESCFSSPSFRSYCQLLFLCTSFHRFSGVDIYCNRRTLHPYLHTLPGGFLLVLD